MGGRRLTHNGDQENARAATRVPFVVENGIKLVPEVPERRSAVHDFERGRGRNAQERDTAERSAGGRWARHGRRTGFSRRTLRSLGTSPLPKVASSTVRGLPKKLKFETSGGKSMWMSTNQVG